MSISTLGSTWASLSSNTCNSTHIMIYKTYVTTCNTEISGYHTILVCGYCVALLVVYVRYTVLLVLSGYHKILHLVHGYCVCSTTGRICMIYSTNNIPGYHVIPNLVNGYNVLLLVRSV